MTPATAITFVLCSLIIGFCVGWLAGVSRGVERGRDQQWMDDFFARIEREKKRRDNQGRFKKQ